MGDSKTGPWPAVLEADNDDRDGDDDDGNNGDDDAEIDINRIMVDIDFQKVEEDSYARMNASGSNQAEMDDAAHEVTRKRRAIRPKATVKGYKKGLACWAAFCARRHYTDGWLVHEKKILLFLKEDVLTKRTPRRGTKTVGKMSIFPEGEVRLVFGPPAALPLTAPMLPLTPESIDAGYISPLIDLWNEQSGRGVNPYPHPRGALLRGLLKTLKKERAEQEREAFEDRALGKLNDGYALEGVPPVVLSDLNNEGSAWVMASNPVGCSTSACWHSSQRVNSSCRVPRSLYT
jgi:hypothetical protein